MSSARSRSTHPDAVDVIIDQWKRELPELASEHMALIGRLKRCSILLAPRLDEVFAAYDLSNGAFDVLATLRRAGAPYILTPTELFASLMVTSGTMTTRLQKVQKRGLIERIPNPDDARSMLVKLTGAGRELVEKVVFEHVENERRILEKLPAETRRQLDAGLAELMQVLEDAKKS